jgi:predicted Mrr-cat superfamily restriction endonuclease
MKKADNFDATKWLVENKITSQSKLNEEEGTDILSFLKSNEQELLNKLASKFKWDEDNIAMAKVYKIGSGVDDEGNKDIEIAGLGDSGLDFSFNPEKVKDTYGDAFNFKLIIAGKPVYGIAYDDM